MKNETEFIKSTKDRVLTAKAQKFLYSCIDIAVKQRGLTRYHQETKPLRAKLDFVVRDLFINKGKSIKEIKEMIKNRNSIFLN